MYLLLRPLPKLANSVATWEQHGFAVTGMAVMDICPDQAGLTAFAQLSIAPSDTFIFTSENAVKFLTSEALRQLASIQPLVIAIGGRTAATLLAHGIDAQRPDLAVSEHILQMPNLQAHIQRGDRIFLCKGHGGRTLLSEHLSDSKATWQSLSLYRRVDIKPVYTQPLQQADITHIVATSFAQAQRIFEIFSDNWLTKRKWIVVSERMASLLSHLGIPPEAITVSPDASDSGLIAAANMPVE